MFMVPSVCIPKHKKCVTYCHSNYYILCTSTYCRNVLQLQQEVHAIEAKEDRYIKEIEEIEKMVSFIGDSNILHPLN